MGYGRSYGMSGTAVPEWQQGLKKCKETMSCTKGRCMSYDGASNKCTCEKCESASVRAGRQTCPKGQSLRCHMGQCWCSNLVPGTTSVERLTAGQMPTVGVNGLGESFLESLGGIANLAIIGLAIYGGYCLAKKI